MSKIHYYASKSKASIQVYVLATEFRLKSKMITLAAYSISQLKGADLIATQSPTIPSKNWPPYSDHHWLPRPWRSTTSLVLKPPC